MLIPIFPLNGAILFPKTNLPLNIFEKRYIEMVDYALSKKRLIGMIQSKKDGNIFELGCLGKITSFNETNDGRYLINLEGINRFVVKKELEKNYAFRIVEVKIVQNHIQKNNKFINSLKTEIINAYKTYIRERKIDIDLKELESIETEQLAKFIAMVSPFDDVDKQMLLEILDIKEFCEKLLSIIEIDTAYLDKKKVFN